MSISNSLFRKGLAWMLCLCMILTLLPAAAPLVFAEGESYVDGMYQGSGQGRNGEIVLSVTIADKGVRVGGYDTWSPGIQLSTEEGYQCLSIRFLEIGDFGRITCVVA